MRIRVIDFETTGIPGDGNDKHVPHSIVEIGWCDVMDDGTGTWTVDAPDSVIVNPGRSIPPQASAIHHLTDSDTGGDRTVPVALREQDLLCRTHCIDVLAGHNSRFDRQFWDGGGRSWIDTYRCALQAFPTAPAHGNQVLRYHLGLDIHPDFSGWLAEPSHRAGPDAYVTAFLLVRLLAERSVEQLVAWSEKPALLPRCNFGKHRGLAWSEVPRDYLDWIVRKSGMDDEDVLHTASHYLS